IVAVIGAAALALDLLGLALLGLPLLPLLALLIVAALLPLLTLRLTLLIVSALLIVATLLLPLLALGLPLLVIAALLPLLLAHFAALLALDLWLLALLALRSRLATRIATTAHFGAAWSAIPAVAALRDLDPLARCLCGGRGDRGQDRCSDQQPSEHLLHLAILQLMSRVLETPAGMMNRFLLSAR
ncbi:MAG: hypothetical protein ACREXP_19975, partial [Steroidobacteraceae bacterium]